MSLTRKTITAGGWVIAHKGFARAAGLIKTIILARLLTPNEFGIFGLTTLALGFLETFSETGIDQALIQQKNLNERHLATSWVISLIRGASISALLFITAPIVDQFFGNHGVTLYIRVIALSPLLKSLKNPRIIELQRELNFKREFILRSAGTIAEVVVGIAVSLYTHNAWGLVASIIAGVIGEVISSYILVRPLSSFLITKNSAAELLGFGRWLWGSSILSYIATQGDNVVVGKLLGPTPLGFYQNAYKLATLPSTQLTSVSNEVSYPALAQISNDHARFIRAFKKTFWTTSGVSLAASTLIITLAYPLTYYIFGPKWLPLVPSLRILSVYGAIKAISSTLGPLFKAGGKPHVLTVHGILFVGVMVTTIVPLTRNVGIEGTSWSVVIASIVTLPYLYVQAQKIIRPNSRL